MKIKLFAGLLASILTSIAVAQVYTIFSPGPPGPVKSNGSYVLQPEVSADIVGLWSGTCSASTFLRGDGACSATNPGTVTSVGLTMPAGFTVGGSPVTSTGTLVVTTALNGVLKGDGSGFTTSTSADIIGLWTGTCSASTFLRGDGACAVAGSGTVTSITAGTGITLSPSPITTTGSVSLTVPVVTANGGTGDTGTFTGPVKANGASAYSAAASTDIVGLWSGTCNSGSFLRGDGNCAAAGGTPAGSNQQLQYNNSGAFGGSAETFDNSTGAFTIAAPTGAITALTINQNAANAGLSIAAPTTSNAILALSNASASGQVFMGSTGGTNMHLATGGTDRITAGATGVTAFAPLATSGGAGGAQIKFGAVGTYSSPNIANGVLSYDSTGGVLTVDSSSAVGNSTIAMRTSNGGTSGIRVTINNSGDVTIGAPVAGTAFTANGVNSANTAVFQAGSTAGASLGVVINGGTNSSDRGLLVQNAAGSTTQFEVFGDGGVVVGSGTTGGDKGAGSINAQSLFVQGAAVSPIYAAVNSGASSCTVGVNLGLANTTCTRTGTGLYQITPARSAVICTATMLVGATQLLTQVSAGATITVNIDNPSTGAGVDSGTALVVCY